MVSLGSLCAQGGDLAVWVVLGWCACAELLIVHLALQEFTV